MLVIPALCVGQHLLTLEGISLHKPSSFGLDWYLDSSPKKMWPEPQSKQSRAAGLRIKSTICCWTVFLKQAPWNPLPGSGSCSERRVRSGCGCRLSYSRWPWERNRRHTVEGTGLRWLTLLAWGLLNSILRWTQAPCLLQGCCED